MPPKVANLKNLTYDQTLPPFLQNLHNHYDRGLEGRDGRHESALLRARPKRTRTAEDDEEDEPVYLDEQGSVVDKEGGKDGGKEESGGAEGDREEGNGRDVGEKPKERERIAAIGSAKRRRVGKIIASDMARDKDPDPDPNPGPDPDPAASKKQPPSESSTTTTPTIPSSSTNNPSKSEPNSAIPSKKEKATTKKKVKLSFGDDE